jgi:hypothetical protein
MEIIYTAPNYQTVDTIAVNFDGDDRYQPTTASISVKVIAPSRDVPSLQTVLSLLNQAEQWARNGNNSELLSEVQKERQYIQAHPEALNKGLPGVIPRLFPEWRSKFIVPSDSLITSKARELGSKERVYEYTSEFIKYEYDHISYDGSPDFWQWPWYTLERGKGDCEDQAILTVCLYRALPMDARVTVGEVQFGGNRGGHAWAEPYWQGVWTVTDPVFYPGVPGYRSASYIFSHPQEYRDFYYSTYVIQVYYHFSDKG